MGVSGCGKSSVAKALSVKLNRPFVEGDSWHSAKNIEKMSAGIPLTDEDRWPWLDLLAEKLRTSDVPVVMACSALKRSYRDRLRAGNGITFVYLQGDRDILLSRMSGREGHFMPMKLLDNQLSVLEEPDQCEPHFVVNIDQPLEQILDQLLQQVITL